MSNSRSLRHSVQNRETGHGHGTLRCSLCRTKLGRVIEADYLPPPSGKQNNVALLSRFCDDCWPHWKEFKKMEQT